MPLPPPQAQLRRYRVIDNRPIADGIFALKISPQKVEDQIPPFEAGQWVNLQVLKPDGSVWQKRAYTIASAPSESTSYLEFGIKIEGPFSQQASKLQPGDPLLVQGPWGAFTLPTGATRLVMLAGGIGITPFRSMVREVCLQARPIDICLLYSSRTCREAAYLNELEQLTRACFRLRLVSICTREPQAPAQELRRIDASLLDTVVGNYALGQFLLCGPRAFMDDLQALLAHRGVEPQRIKRELFS